MNRMAPDVATLLDAHGINASEQPLSHDGYSGARITFIEQGGARYVLKRIRTADDWIMRLTHDDNGREAEFAISTVAGRLPPTISTPTIGAAHDGDGWAILMRDVRGALLPGDGPISVGTLDLILQRLAQLHTTFWEDPELGKAPFASFSCPVRDRVRLLSPEVGADLIEEGRDFGLAGGWEVFFRIAPRNVAEFVASVFDSASPSLDLGNSLPLTLIHGDAKFANIGIEDDGRLVLIDWALVARAPAAWELAWFLAVNSSRLPSTLDEALGLYADHLVKELGPRGGAEWERQRATVGIIGVLMYGWGKALDAEAGHADELFWWCERAAEGLQVLGIR